MRIKKSKIFHNWFDVIHMERKIMKSEDLPDYTELMYLQKELREKSPCLRIIALQIIQTICAKGFSIFGVSLGIHDNINLT